MPKGWLSGIGWGASSTGDREVTASTSDAGDIDVNQGAFQVIAGADAQAVLDDIDDEFGAHYADTVDAHDASSISTLPYPIDADSLFGSGVHDVQTALDSVDQHAHTGTAPHGPKIAAASVTADSTTLVGTGTNVQAVFEELDDAVATDIAALATHAGAADPHTGYLKESNTIDFLVGTTQSELGGEIVVGAAPGGELGGTWASPTVDEASQGWVVVRKASDETVNGSTTMQNDDELFFTATSTVVYEIEWFIIYTGNATADIKFDHGEDSTVRGDVSTFRLNASNAGANQAIEADQTTTLIAGAAATKRVIAAKGWYTGAGGTYRFRWAQSTSDASDTKVLAGSRLRYRVIS